MILTSRTWECGSQLAEPESDDPLHDKGDNKTEDSTLRAAIGQIRSKAALERSRIT